MRRVRINDFLEELEVYDNEYTNEDLAKTEEKIEELKSLFQEEKKEKTKYNYFLMRLFLGLVEVVDIVTIIKIFLVKENSIAILITIVLFLNIFAGIILGLTKDYK